MSGVTTDSQAVNGLIVYGRYRSPAEFTSTNSVSTVSACYLVDGPDLKIVMNNTQRPNDKFSLTPLDALSDFTIENKGGRGASGVKITKVEVTGYCLTMRDNTADKYYYPSPNTSDEIDANNSSNVPDYVRTNLVFNTPYPTFTIFKYSIGDVVSKALPLKRTLPWLWLTKTNPEPTVYSGIEARFTFSLEANEWSGVRTVDCWSDFIVD
ncbi:MAG: hypothetical protein ABI600_17925 [Luteolibacter sp.]